jgi:predicted porin
VGDADTFAYYVEAKYKFTPQFFGAVRWNQQIFNKISNGYGTTENWTPDLVRIDVAATYRLTTHAQFKLQYSYQHETTAPSEDNHLLATQFTVRF